MNTSAVSMGRLCLQLLPLVSNKHMISLSLCCQSCLSASLFSFFVQTPTFSVSPSSSGLSPTQQQTLSPLQIKNRNSTCG